MPPGVQPGQPFHVQLPAAAPTATRELVLLLAAGAAPLPLHVHEFLVAAVGCDVVQGYGMTENCANATLARRCSDHVCNGRVTVT